MICITCGENEAINDFYKECLGCIIDWEKELEMKEMLKNE